MEGFHGDGFAEECISISRLVKEALSQCMWLVQNRCKLVGLVGIVSI